MRHHRLALCAISGSILLGIHAGGCEGNIGENVGGNASGSTTSIATSSGVGSSGSVASTSGQTTASATTQASSTDASSGDASSTADTSASVSSTASASASSSSASSSSGGVIDCDDPVGSAPALTLALVEDNFDFPVLVKSAPDDPDRLYVVEQSGRVIVVDGGVALATPFIDVSGSIRDGGEEGLLGLAFHPEYAQNGRFFLHYSAAGNGDSTVMEFARSANPLVADDTPVQLVLDFTTTSADNHNGGAIEFGEDGYLYISLGDGGSQGDPECDAQLLSSPPGDPAVNGPNYLGKILRVDVDAAPDASGYPAAPGNPGGHKAYHSGFRNPWRMSFDACTGDLFVGDVGQGSYEEIDRITTAQGPQNCGWPYLEATTPYGANACPAAPGGLLAPFSFYAHDPGGHCAIAGGYVYRSAEMPGLRGSYFYGDYCSGGVWMAQGMPGGGFAAPVRMASLELGLSISGFGQDGRGNVYVVNLNGEVYRIVPD